MVRQSTLRPSAARAVVRAAIVLILSHGASLALAQRAPVSPDHPWHGLGEERIEADARDLTERRFDFDPGKTYSLPGLIDLAESHNPETRVAWERARAQAAAWGVARSELYPTIAAAAIQISRPRLGVSSICTIAFGRDALGSQDLKNGELLKQAEAAKFDVLLPLDRGFEYQRKLADRQIAVIVFCGKSVLFEDLLPLMTTCFDHLKTIRPGG